MRRVLFLDIDGVLNDTRFRAHKGKVGVLGLNEWAPGECIDRARVERVNRAIEGLDVEVVISSSWKNVMPLDDVAKHLADAGFAGRIVGKTRKISALSRHVEIKEWLSFHSMPIRFAVLDDDPGAGVGLDHQFVRCCDGIEDEQAERLRRVLE